MARAFLSLALILTTVACSSKSSSPTAPTTATSTVVTSTPPPSPPAAPTCSSWASQQRASGVPAPAGDVAGQREALYAAGGGIRAVDGRYYAAVFPSGFATASQRRVLVGLHGTGGAPETEWSVDWQANLPSRGWGYLGLKYVNDATGQHDDVQTIYNHLKAMIDEVKNSCDLGSVSLFLVGFSRGSAESFSLSYLDLRDRRLFKAIGNNSGGWPDSTPVPPTLAGIEARGETTAMAGARHWLYCGEKDFSHGYSMCVEMQVAADFITRYGATVAKLYKDPTGTHGALTKNPDAVGQMLAYFEGL